MCISLSPWSTWWSATLRMLPTRVLKTVGWLFFWSRTWSKWPCIRSAKLGTFVIFDGSHLRFKIGFGNWSFAARWRTIVSTICNGFCAFMTWLTTISPPRCRAMFLDCIACWYLDGPALIVNLLGLIRSMLSRNPKLGLVGSCLVCANAYWRQGWEDGSADLWLGGENFRAPNNDVWAPTNLKISTEEASLEPTSVFLHADLNDDEPCRKKARVPLHHALLRVDPLSSHTASSAIFVWSPFHYKPWYFYAKHLARLSASLSINYLWCPDTIDPQAQVGAAIVFPINHWGAHR